MDAVTLALLKALGGGSGLPSTGSASVGDVLSLDNNKTPQWAAPSGGGGVLVVHDVEGTLDKTWQEIWDAAGTGPAYILTIDSGERDCELITAVLANAHRLSTASGVFYAAESANDYPVMSE